MKNLTFAHLKGEHNPFPGLKELLNRIVLLCIFVVSSLYVSAQNCTANAGGNVTICDDSTRLVGSVSGLLGAGGPTWSFVSGPTIPTIVSPNSMTTDVTGMSVSGDYLFKLSIPCGSGVSESFVTVSAHARPASFTAGTDITGVCATVGSVNLNGDIPPGFTGYWSALSLANPSFYGSNNSSFNNPNIENPVFSLTNATNHNYDPAYTATLTITSTDGLCQYTDDVIIKFCPNPQINIQDASFCLNSGSSQGYYDLSTPPFFNSNYSNAAGSTSSGTTITLNVISQPAGANMTFLSIDRQRINFDGVSVPGTYTYSLTITTCCGTYTTPVANFVVNGISPRPAIFQVPGHSAPEQLTVYAYGSSHGEVHCDLAGTNTPEMFYFNLDPVDSPTLISTVTSTGILPPGASTPIITVFGANTMNRSVSVDPGPSGWIVGTYKFNVTLSSGGCNNNSVYFIHISDNSRLPINVSDVSICYPGAGTVSATIQLPEVYKQVVNSSYFQEFGGWYNFNVISQPAGSLPLQFESTSNRDLSDVSTVISNFSMPGDYVIRILPFNGNGVGTFLEQEYACSGITQMYDDFVVHVDAQINANAGADQVLNCSSDVYLQGNNPGTGTGSWLVTNVPPGASVPTITAPNSQQSSVVDFDMVGTYSYQYTITSTHGACTSSDNVMMSFASLSPDAPVITTVSPTCSNGLLGQVTINNPLPSSNITYSINDGVTYQSGNVFSNLPAGNYEVIYYSASLGCNSYPTSFSFSEPSCPDLSITKTINDPTPDVGDVVTFTITAENIGNVTSTGVVVNEVIPSGYSVISVVPASGTWTAPNWNIGTLASGASTTLTISASVNCSGNYNNIASISGNEIEVNLLNNSDNVSISPTDVTSPVFNGTLPSNVTVSCEAIPSAPVLTAVDNCGTATVTFNEVLTAGSCVNSYTLTRTWVATDAAGNTATHIQVVTVQDNTAPVFNGSLPANVTVSCNAIPVAPVLTATDNCSTPAINFFESISPGSCPNSYTITRTWMAMDACENLSSHVQVITVQDNVAPTFSGTLPTNVTVSCGAVPSAAVLTATDNCGAATVSYNEVTTAGACANNYTLTRTWTATDVCGNTTTHTQVVTVQDNTAPVFNGTLPTNVTVSCDAIPSAVVLTATDNCGAATVSYNEVTTAGTCANSYTLTRTWTATDICGNATTHTQVVTVQDNTAPVFNGTLPSNVTVSCDAIPSAVVLTATDNCGAANVTYNQVTTAGTCANSYTLTRTWTATDVCGNATSHTQVITVQDNTVPVFDGTLPSNVTVSCDAIPSAAVLTATDNCGTATVTYNQVTTAGTCANSYTLTRTWTATDVCGNATSHAQVITVQDNTAPVFNGSLPTNVTVSCEAVPSATVLIATDNCGAATVSYNEVTTAGTCANNYTLTRTWTATDVCGNATTHTQVVTVQDNTAPVFNGTLPSNVTVSCEAVPSAAVLTATDNCGAASVSYNEVTTAGACANNYTLTRTWTATDVCGNTTTHTQVVTVQDNTAPVFSGTLPTNVTVSCDAIPSAVVLTATDNCGAATVSYNEVTTAGTCANSYTLTRTWTATDICGNATTHTQVVTVQDNTAPVFNGTLPSNVTVSCDAIPSAVVLTATDNCGTATVSYNEVTTATSCANYTLTRTWIATDVCGNATSHTQTITVQDNTAPVFVETLPINVTVSCESVPSAAVLTATDNCGTATVSYNEVTTVGTCANSYTLTRTWTATDVCGNATSHTQVITVQDNTAPVFVESLPVDVTVSCETVPAAPTLTATDNCGAATVSYNEVTTAGACANSYVLTRTWTATDVCGNAISHTQVVTVQDNTAPVFVESLPVDVTVSCETVPAAPTLTATDNCGAATVSYTEVTIAGSCANTYTLTRTWTATDVCGNTTSHTQVVTVQDNTAPVFVESLPVDVTVDCDAVPTASTLTATDNCGTATVSYTEVTIAGSCANSYTLTRTWIATDVCGNTTTYAQVVTVQDTTAPVFVEVLPVDMTVNCDAVPDVTILTATDNCGSANVAYNEITLAGSCANSYTLTRTWTATDVCGNTTIHTQTITLQDTSSPVISGIPSDISVSNQIGLCGAEVTWIAPVATDNCGEVTLTSSHTIGEVFPVGTTVVTYTAVDECGNTTSSSFNVTVEDTENPAINIVVQGPYCEGQPVTWVEEISDNCGVDMVTSTIQNGSVLPVGTTTVTYTVTDIHGNDSTLSVQVVVHENPTVEVVQNEVAVCSYADLLLSVKNPELNTSYEWTFDGGSIGQGNNVTLNDVNMENSGVYIVTATSQYGCLNTDTTTVVVKDCEIDIVEAFSPNGDGTNEFFHIENLDGYPGSKVWIYNRWGTEVYMSEDYHNDWDGRSQSSFNIAGDELPEGTYFYVLELGKGSDLPLSGKVYNGYVYIKR